MSKDINKGGTIRTIFIVTTIRFGMKTIKVGKNRGRKIFGIIDKRTVGWFPILKSGAQKCVEKNQGDIYESGTYPWAVIEEIPYGVYPPTNEWWYEWDSEKGKYIPGRKPGQYKRVTNFAMG